LTSIPLGISGSLQVMSFLPSCEDFLRVTHTSSILVTLISTLSSHFLHYIVFKVQVSGCPLPCRRDDLYLLINRYQPWIYHYTRSTSSSQPVYFLIFSKSSATGISSLYHMPLIGL